MALRALSVILPPPLGAALALTPGMPHRTGLCLLMPPTDADSGTDETRDTQPPSEPTQPPSGYDPLPSEALKRITGYDPNVFLHAALMAAADAAHQVRQSNKLSSDFARLLDKQTERILKETSADYGSLRSSITGLQQSVDALATRLGVTEIALDAGTKRFAAIEDELAAMRSQMARLEELRAHLERLEGRLAELKHTR